MTTHAVNEDQLRAILPQCQHPADWVRPLNDAMERYEIDENVKRVAAFIGQIAVESSQLNRLEENLNYNPRRLTEVWPSRFKDIEFARGFARNPERLANYVYADRLGNGSVGSGDGFRYRGRGLMQITGRANYADVGARLDLDLVNYPDRLLQPTYAALAAAAFWSDKRLNEVADDLARSRARTVIRLITKRVNGGMHGFDERVVFTLRALDVLDPLEEAA